MAVYYLEPQFVEDATRGSVVHFYFGSHSDVPQSAHRMLDDSKTAPLAAMFGGNRERQITTVMFIIPPEAYNPNGNATNVGNSSSLRNGRKRFTKPPGVFFR